MSRARPPRAEGHGRSERRGIGMRIVGGGDAVVASRSVRERIGPGVADVLDSADALAVNAEFTTPDPATPPIRPGYSLAVDPEVVDELASLGVTLVGGANNHCWDYGPQGVLATIRQFRGRGIAVAGVGATLGAAREPAFVDTARGRVALVAASATRGSELMAWDAGRRTPSRPGLNPLRWTQAYELPDAEFRQLRRIDDLLGTRAAHADYYRVEIKDQPTDDAFEFGSPQATGAVRVRRGRRARVVWDANAEDLRELARSVREGRRRADAVVVSLHSHEGAGDGWYAEQPASFLIEAAHAAVDAGAAGVFGHGPHMLRGIEVYRGRPIFYSLNSLTLDFEMGDLITPSMYQAYGLPLDSFPGDLHGLRRRDERGNPRGFWGEPRFSHGALAVLDVGEDGGVRTSVVPLDLRLNAERHGQRGMPALARGAVREAILADLRRMSEPFGTRLTPTEDGEAIRVEGTRLGR